MKTLTLGRMIVALVMILFCCMIGIALACAVSGCAGFGSGTPKTALYTFNIAKDAKSTIVVGSAGTQTYMPQTLEVADVPDATKLTATTGPELLASGATAAGVAKGKMSQVIVGADNAKRTAENDVSAAMQALAGNEQTTAGQTPAMVQRQGEAAATGTTTSTPMATKTTTVKIPLTGQGSATVDDASTNTGTGTATPSETATPAAEAGTTGVEVASKITKNADGSYTVVTDKGTHTGELLRTPTEAGGQYVLLRTDGSPVAFTCVGCADE